MLKLINPWAVVALLVSHGALIGWAGSAEWRLRGEQAAHALQAQVWAETHREAAERIAELQRTAIEDERRAAQALADADEQHRQETERAQAAADSAIAGLRAGHLRLRQRLAAAQCPAGVPGAAATADGGDGADGSGLQPADAEFLVRESERADVAVRRLSLCQATIDEYLRLNGAARP